jgi:hypothetical protein
LTKFLVLLPTEATFSALTVADLFLHNVVKRFGFPISIISDRDPRFISAFWKGLLEKAGVKRSMSSAAHPQTDGVTEQANRTISSMIRSYTFNRPTEWASSLPVLEIAYNDSVNGSTGYTPYFLCSGTHPILPLSLYSKPTFLAAETAEKSVENYVSGIRKDIEAARAAMLKAQATQIKNANRFRRELIFQVGDQVLLSEGHFRDSTHGNLAQADGSTKKLNAIYRGPFAVTEVISDVSYRLQLPDYMKSTHNAFHVSRLRPYLTTEAFPARAAKLDAPKPTKEGGEEHFEVAEFCGHRLTGRGGVHLQVLVQYKGYLEKEWQFCEDLSKPPGMDEQSYFDTLMKYSSLKPRGTGPKGRPPNETAILELQLRLQSELKRAENAANAGLKRLSKLRNATSLRNDKKNPVADLGKTDVVVDLPRGGGKRAVVKTPVETSPTPTNDVTVHPNPLRSGTREGRAAARAYANADAKPAESLLNNLTEREYHTRTRAGIAQR